MAAVAERITVNPDQCGGRPCVRSLRIRVTDVLDLLASGLSPDEVLAELHDRFAAVEHGKERGPRGRDETAEPRVGRVATRDQDDLRRRSVLLEQLNEVGVFREHDRARLAGSHEDLRVGRALSVQVTDGHAFEAPVWRASCGQRRRKLVIEPDRHKATMG